MLDCSLENHRNVYRSLSVVFLLFFLSGIAALIYEISWTRQIGLLFGHTIHAASIVLASFFAGMAIGYLSGARWVSRIDPLLGYTVAELVIAVWALLVPLILSASHQPAFIGLLSHDSFELQLLFRAVFGFFLLLPATAAMGATLPFIAEYLSRKVESTKRARQKNKIVSYAYAINTLGAFAGVSFATFYSLVNVGVRNSSYLAALLSAACAVAAYLLYRNQHTVNTTEFSRRSDEKEVTADDQQAVPCVVPRHSPNVRWLYGFAVLSGFGTLAFQVLYLRIFSLVFHNSTYTFGLVVAVFIVSLAIGAALAAQLQRRTNPDVLLGGAAGLGAIFATLSVFVFAKITKLDYFSSGDSFIAYMSGAFWLVTVVVAPAIVCFGMILPLTWLLADNRTGCGRSVGNLTAVNTIAASLGAIVTSFLLLLWTGLWGTFVLVAGLFLLAAITVLSFKSKLFLNVGICVAFFVTSFLAINAPTDSAHNRAEYDEVLVRRWNSAYGWIDLVERKDAGIFKIRQNLHYRFGTTGTNAREYRQAHIPLLLHDDPKDVLFLGLGTGLTAGGAVPHPNVQRIEAVELIPEVVEAAESLAEHNHGVVGHLKVKVYVDDARHHLMAHDAMYDVIISDLFVPWESESGYLYTVEHYQVASSRLKPEGMFCQWLPLYQLGPREFELIANSFASVFPSTTIWWAQLETTSPVIGLIGTQTPLKVDIDSLNKRIEGLRANQDAMDPTIAMSHRLLDLYLGDWAVQQDALLNTDEHPRVEFLTPVSNRNRRMIRGDELKNYYQDVLGQLTSSQLIVSGETEEDEAARRALQQAILFGR